MRMEALSRWVVATFASPFGVFALAVADSTLFFSLPFGIDGAIVVVAARNRELAWAIPLIATAGSLAGAALTFWLGSKAGDAGLERLVPASRLKRVRQKVNGTGALALGASSIIPPPFPFTPFVLAAGALDVDKLPFFAMVGLTRLLRFGIAAWLAVRYGSSIVRWLEAPAVQYSILACVAVALAAGAWSVYQLVRRTRRPAAA